MPVQISAVSADFVHMSRYEFLQGRFFTIEEEADEAPVVVIKLMPCRQRCKTVGQINQSVVTLRTNHSAWSVSSRKGRMAFRPMVGSHTSSCRFRCSKNSSIRKAFSVIRGELVIYNLQLLAEDVPHVDKSKRYGTCVALAAWSEL